MAGVIRNFSSPAPYSWVAAAVVADLTAPVISLVGGDTAISVGASYTAPTVTAIDDTDGDLTNAIVVSGDTVDANTIGSYTALYDVSDAAGNAAVQVSHTVVVSASLRLGTASNTVGPLTQSLQGHPSHHLAGSTLNTLSSVTQTLQGSFNRRVIGNVQNTLAAASTRMEGDFPEPSTFMLDVPLAGLSPEISSVVLSTILQASEWGFEYRIPLGSDVSLYTNELLIKSPTGVEFVVPAAVGSEPYQEGSTTLYDTNTYVTCHMGQELMNEVGTWSLQVRTRGSNSQSLSPIIYQRVK